MLRDGIILAAFVVEKHELWNLANESAFSILDCTPSSV